MPRLNEFTVGWMCALSTEHVAACEFLDEEYEGADSRMKHDNNHYTLGRIGKHNVVIAVLPDGEYGTNVAANVATDLIRSFPNIRIGLMVGTGGGAPGPKHDIRLGDVVVSSPGSRTGGVLQYDFGKTIQHQSFQMTGFLNAPPQSLRTAVNGLKTMYTRKGNTIHRDVEEVLRQNPWLRHSFGRPDKSKDLLYRSDFAHRREGDCADVCGIDASLSVARSARSQLQDDPAIHYGIIASANQLMKDAEIRDSLSKEHDVLCFEMEAAGLMNRFPCLVVRGICNYADSHKNKEWQGYAAMTAAAYAKSLLQRITPERVESEEKLNDVFIEELKGLRQHVNIVRQRVFTIDQTHQNSRYNTIRDRLSESEHERQISEVKP